jgi:hypothetical protein
VVGVGSGIDVAEVGVTEGIGVGVAVGVGVAEGIGVGVAVGVGVAEGIGVGVTVGVGVTEGIGVGVAVGVGVAEGVGVAGPQAKSNAPMENKSGPNSSLFILCSWGRDFTFGVRFIQVPGNTSSLFHQLFLPAATRAAPSVLNEPIRQDVGPSFLKN